MTVSGAHSNATRGSTLVEFSVSVFLLLMIMFGVVELQRMLFVYNTVADSARAGVRYAIVHGSFASPACGPANNPTNVVSVVQTFASASLLNTSKLTAACPISASGGICVTYAPPPEGSGSASNTPGSLVTVQVSYPYDPFVGWFSSLLGVNLTSTSQGAVVY